MLQEVMNWLMLARENEYAVNEETGHEVSIENMSGGKFLLLDAEGVCGLTFDLDEAYNWLTA